MQWVSLEDGQVHECQVLIAVLPYSQYTFAIALASQKVLDLAHGITEALLFFRRRAASYPLGQHEGFCNPPRARRLRTEWLVFFGVILQAIWNGEHAAPCPTLISAKQASKVQPGNPANPSCLFVPSSPCSQLRGKAIRAVFASGVVRLVLLP